MSERHSLPIIAAIGCQDCGACCREQAGLPISWYLGPYSHGDPAILPPALLSEMEATLQDWLRGHFPEDGEPCVWYDADKRQCRHYEFRPEICAELEVGSEDCQRWREEYGI